MTNVVAAIEFSQRIVTGGVLLGLTYAVFAAGFVLVFRSTGVINFAHAEIGAFGAAMLPLLVGRYHFNYWLAFVIAVASAASLAMVVELVVVRRLFDKPRLVVLIATLGVAQLMLVARITLPKPPGGAFPVPNLPVFTAPVTPTDQIRLLDRDLLVLFVVPVLILGLGAVLRYTRFGLAMRASAVNPDTARIYGISVKRTSTIVWIIAGAFAGATSILVAPLQGTTAGSASGAAAVALSSTQLLRALVVALLARMRSIPATLVAGIGVGVFETVVRNAVGTSEKSVVEAYMLVIVLVAVLVIARRARSGDTAWSLAPRDRGAPDELRTTAWIRRLPGTALTALFMLLAIIPWVFDKPSELDFWAKTLILALVGLSLTVLTGWAGQLSLGQYAFVGFGALSTLAFTLGHDIPIPFDWFDATLRLPWVPAVTLAVGLSAFAAVVVGLPALRVRGLYLAVTTLAFAVVTASWLFSTSFFTGGGTTTRPMPSPAIAGVDFANRRTFYYLVLGVVAGATAITARLRRSGIGRGLIAVRENEEMAAASTVSTVKAKLLAFALAGGMAGLAGALLITTDSVQNPTQVYTPIRSIEVVATAVIGGLGSIAGPFLGALFVNGLPRIFGNSDQVRLMTSSIGLLILIMYLPGGLLQIVHAGRDALFRVAMRHLPAPASTGAAAATRAVPALATRSRGPEPPLSGAWLDVVEATVRYGGNVAVDAVSLHVDAGELVGLIGTNGAGKSTLMNGISGFVPMRGKVALLGTEIGSVSAPRRHAMGLGRTFQSARLYPDLTVRETIMVALEAREHSWFVPSMIGLPPSPRMERTKRSDAEELISFLGLGRYADEFVGTLSTGTRRIVEFCCLMAVDAKVLLLDEPTGGVAQKETEAFGPLIKRIQRELGASLLVIEHDMPLIMSISDRVYCLEAGAVIAEGVPADVRDNPVVIASYLGTDERAIQRSNA